MEETTFLSKPGLFVSSARIDINGQTFAVRNVGSVRVDQLGFPLVRGLLGLLFAFSGLLGACTPSEGRGIALVLLAVGAAMLWSAWQRMQRRKLILVTGGGEVSAYESTDGSVVEELRSAVAQAISVR